MINSIQDVKTLRKNLDMTQKELAEASGVSQSLIAKIEAGLIDPSFSKAKKIIDALESVKKETTILVKKIMRHPIVYVKPTDTTKQIAKLMRSKGYSQLPVMDGDFILGLITESDLINALASNKIIATDIMRDAPPVVTADTSIEPVIDLLKHFPCVLVTSKGQIAGIVTKSDVIGKL